MILDTYRLFYVVVIVSINDIPPVNYLTIGSVIVMHWNKGSFDSAGII